MFIPVDDSIQQTNVYKGIRFILKNEETVTNFLEIIITYCPHIHIQQRFQHTPVTEEPHLYR